MSFLGLFLPSVVTSTASFVWFFFFLSTAARTRDLPSFPTRRSSDLAGRIVGDRRDVPFGDGPADDLGKACLGHRLGQDRKSTRLNSSHLVISYAVFCLKKKNKVD